MSEAPNGRRGALPPGVSHFRDLGERLREEDYLADEGLATAIFLAIYLGLRETLVVGGILYIAARLTVNSSRTVSGTTI